MRFRVVALVVSGLGLAITACLAVALASVLCCTQLVPGPSPGPRAPLVGADEVPVAPDPPRTAPPRAAAPAPDAGLTAAAQTAAQDGAKTEPTATFRVRVVDAVTSAAVAHAEVVLAHDEDGIGARAVRTDDDGRALFEGIAGTSRAVRVTADGYVPTPWAAAPIAPGEASAVTIELVAGVVLEGAVRDRTSGAAIAGARVTIVRGGVLDGESAPRPGPPLAFVETSADGRFRARVAADALVTAKVAAAGYAPVERTVRSSRDAESHAPIEIRLERAGRLAGTVRDPDGRPVAARVYAVPDDGQAAALLLHPEGESQDDEGRTSSALKTTAAEDGSYVLDGLSFDGAYLVFARAGGWARSAVRTGLVVTAESPARGTDFVLQRPATLIVQVVGPDGGAVLARVVVRTDITSASVADADATGVARFEFREPVPTTIDVDAPGLLAARVVVVLAPGATETATVRLVRGLAITGRAVDDRGEPVENAYVIARGDSPAVDTGLPPSDAVTTSGPDGRFVLDGLRPSAYLVHGLSRGHVTPGDLPAQPPSDDVRVVLVRLGHVRLRLVPPPGAEAPDGFMFLVVPRAWSAPRLGDDVWIGRSGREAWKTEPFELPVDPGGCRLHVLTGTYAPVERWIDVEPGATADLGDVLLDPGHEAAGRVVDASGARVEGARVETGWPSGPAHQSVVTGKDGRFLLRRLAAGRVHVSVRAPGFLMSYAVLEADSAAEPAVLRLERGGVVRIRAAGNDGRARPAVRVVVHALRADGTPWERATCEGGTDFRGRCELRLAAGRYRVSAKDLGAASDVAVVEGADADVELVVR